MSSNKKYSRLSRVAKAPFVAGLDHRHFLDKDGNDIRLQSLSRYERRRLKAESKKIGHEYKKIFHALSNSGANYPIDKLLREMCIEYTHRYATAGYYSQPVNFNYFEAFCNIDFIRNTIAPYVEPIGEHDHLFNVIDYLDYVTSPDNTAFALEQLKSLPEGQIYHFTINGDLTAFTFLSPHGREFVVSGFSMVRHDYLLHWYLLGGEVYSEQEWEKMEREQNDMSTANTSAYKRTFLNESMEKHGSNAGVPIALEGTKTTQRTVIAGETNLDTSKHLARCYMSERENAFNIICDDPEILQPVRDQAEREEIIRIMQERVEDASVLWNLAEMLFQLPSYFAYKIRIQKSVLAASGRSIKRGPKSARGVGANFHRVSAIEVAEMDTPVVMTYTYSSYEVETDGHWRRLQERDSYGRGPNGEMVRGRTWIKSSNKWRERPSGRRTIYVKSSVAAAKLTAEEIIQTASDTNTKASICSASTSDENKVRGVLYVLRCITMKDGVYKIGWTSGSAHERAKDLSTATGVPSAFVLVDYWQHEDPEALESNVHAMLDPYRINESREFFQIDFETIKRLIEEEIARTDRSIV